MPTENIKITGQGKNFLELVYMAQVRMNGGRFPSDEQQVMDIFINNADCVKLDVMGKRIVSTFGTENLAKAVVEILRHFFTSRTLPQSEFVEVAFLAFEILLHLEVKLNDPEKTRDWHVVIANLEDYLHVMDSLQRAVSDSMEAMSKDD